MKLIKIENEGHFLELHHSVIGASDAATILGMNKYRTAYDLYCLKKGLIEPDADNEPMFWGRRLEPIIIEEAQKKIGTTIETGWFGISDQVPYIGCQFDGLIFGEDRKILATVEVKNIGSFNMSDWGDEWSDSVPDQYNLQVQHQRYVAQEGTSEPILAYLVALLGGNRLKVFQLPHKPEIMAIALPAYAEFKRLLDAGEPPEITGADSTAETIKRMYPETTGEEIEAPEHLLPIISKWQICAKTISQLEVQEQECKNQVAAAMGATACVTGGFGKITFKPQQAVSWKNVAEELNAPHSLIEKFTKHSRVIRSYWKKEK